MEALRILKEDRFGESRFVTAQVRSVDGSPLFSSMFFHGTPANPYGPPFKNKLTTSEGEALAHHESVVVELRRSWKP